MTVNLVTVERERERAILLEKKSTALKSSLTHTLDNFIELANSARFFVMGKKISSNKLK